MTHLEALEVSQLVLDELLEAIPLDREEGDEKGEGGAEGEEVGLEGREQEREETKEEGEEEGEGLGLEGREKEKEETKEEEGEGEEEEGGREGEEHEQRGEVAEEGEEGETEGREGKRMDELFSTCQPLSDVERQLDKETRLQILLRLFQLACAMVSTTT